MSVFGKMIRRADGKEERKEDEIEIYFKGNGGYRMISKFKVGGKIFLIHTNGECASMSTEINVVSTMGETPNEYFNYRDVVGEKRTLHVARRSGTVWLSSNFWAKTIFGDTELSISQMKKTAEIMLLTFYNHVK